MMQNLQYGTHEVGMAAKCYNFITMDGSNGSITIKNVLIIVEVLCFHFAFAIFSYKT